MNEKNVDRRIKREVYGKPQSVRLLAAPGWQAVLVAEVKQVLSTFSLPSKFSPVMSISDQSIDVSTLDFRNLIELPIRLQTAADIRWSLMSRHVGSFGEFQAFLEKCPWDLFLSPGSAVQVKVESYRSKLFHEGKLSEIIKDHLKEQGYRVEHGESACRLYFEQIENRHELWVSMTQDPLFHRGYKAALGHRAPLQEHLAAAAIHWFFGLPEQRDWQADLVYVPFAGSGTLWAEMMILQLGIPLNNWRSQLGFEQWPCFPKASWQNMEHKREGACLDQRQQVSTILLEKDESTADKLKAHAQKFLRDGKLKFPDLEPRLILGDFFEFEIESNEAKVFLPLNPPYGIRLEQGEDEGTSLEAPQFYQKLGERLQFLLKKQRDMRGFVLVPDPESLRSFTSALGAAHVLSVHHFSQGGQHIRAVSFKSAED